MDRLSTGVARQPVILISTPPGYGKSTLIQTWAGRGDGSDPRLPTIVLALTPEDAVPGILQGHVAAALCRSTLPSLRSLGDRTVGLAPDQVVAHLLNGLATVGEIAVAVDGYEHLAPMPAQLLDYLPPDLHLVLSGRGAPPVPVGRLRMRGLLGELGIGDLAFTPAQVAQAATGAGYGSPSADHLWAQTLGWPKGLHLLLAPDSSVTTRAYFDVLLEKANNPFTAFLRATAHLDVLTAATVNAATGRLDAQAILEVLEKQGVLLLPLGAERRAWRYHPMFAAYLRGFCGAT